MKTLLIIDVQNDFCPGGALAVPGGDTIIPVINSLIPNFDAVIQTQDWHPEGHHSFASSHNQKEPYDTVEMEYGDQVLWPDHCVQGTGGAEFHPELHTTKTEVVIRKGFRKQIDSYSTFYENDQKTPTGLTGYLRERGISEIYVAGLATDFCVKWSVIDGLKKEFIVHVIEDAVKGIDMDGSVEQAWKEMKGAGAEITTSGKIQF
ncbi:MAG TPA: bifunctional nicotinamidase/pyrazinamidase [Bacteroidales bacterium]|nr:bifunctional nicotinamidase/pyrazinamidase [Bacteroidales bacterium]